MNIQKQKYVTSPYFQHCDNRPFENAWSIFPGDEPIRLNDEELSLLRFCTKPIYYNQLLNVFSQESITKMIGYHFLTKYETAWHLNRLQSVEIETSKYCNWRCSFCPNKDNQNLQQKIMANQLFLEILQKIQDFGSVNYVTLNTYNEPVLDPLFLERIQYLKKFNLKLILYTNGSALTNEMIQELKQSGCLQEIWFNVPSLQPERFKEITGYSHFNKVIAVVNKAIEAGLNVNFSIQGQTNERQKTLTCIREKYQEQIKHPIISWPTHDRAGNLKGEFNQNIHIKQNRLFGCNAVISQLHINMCGDAFLCCNDYFQKHKFGNIQDASLFDLLNSENAIFLRKQVYGNTQAPDDLLCRHCIEMKRQMVLLKLIGGK